MKKLYRKFKRWMDYDPPGALSSRGWASFRREFKEKAPIRYWVRENYRYKIQLPIKWKFEEIESWFYFRTVRRLHVVKTGLPPGYNDLETRILHTNFTMLVDFVEVEQAWHYYVSNFEDFGKTPWYLKYLPYRKTFFRRPDLGLAYLQWASGLDDPSVPVYQQCGHQAKSAREIFELYDWWKNKRPNRKDIVVPPVPKVDDEFDLFGTDQEDTPEYKAFRKAMDKQAQLESDWEEEDSEMLMRLIKIRRELWV